MKNIRNKSELNLLSLEMIEDYYAGKIKRYTTGSLPVDRYIAYLQKTFNLVGGRTSEGKTRFLINLIMKNLDLGVKVLYVTGEDADELVNLKMLEQEVGLDAQKIFNKEYYFNDIKKLIIKATEQIKECHHNLLFKNVGKVTLKDAIEIMTEAKKLGVELFIYDHLQTIAVPGQSVYDRHSQIAEEFRNQTKELGLCTIGCVQLNRESDPTRSNKPPSIANLKGSGDYEEVAHSCILVKRKRKKMLDGTWKPTDFIEIHIPKNRIIGKCGVVNLTSEYEGMPDELLRQFKENERDRW